MPSVVLGVTLARQVAGRSGSNCSKLAQAFGVADGLPKPFGSSHVVIQVATLRAVHGDKYPYEEPYPYWKKPYKLRGSFYDYTLSRFNENTKIITVEGNIGVGKKEFAIQLAKEFDLKYFGPTPESNCFTKYNSYGYDVRQLDHLIPEATRSYDLKKFYMDKHPEKGKIGKLQLMWYEQKWYDYIQALKHLSSTGQGVVMVRSVYSDVVFAEALRKMGYVTAPFLEYYNMYRANTICELLKPHLAIYLDAPLSVIRSRIKERNDPKEVNSAVLSDKYLQAISDAYQQKFLPFMRKHGEVVEMDWIEKPTETDIDVIAEELQLLSLEPENNDDIKFEDWTRTSEDDWIKIRLYLEDKIQQNGTFNLPLPWDCPEIMPTFEDCDAYHNILDEHPVFKYEKGWNPDMGDKVLFKN